MRVKIPRTDAPNTHMYMWVWTNTDVDLPVASTEALGALGEATGEVAYLGLVSPMSVEVIDDQPEWSSVEFTPTQVYPEQVTRKVLSTMAREILKGGVPRNWDEHSHRYKRWQAEKGFHIMFFRHWAEEYLKSPHDPRRMYGALSHRYHAAAWDLMAGGIQEFAPGSRKEMRDIVKGAPRPLLVEGDLRKSYCQVMTWHHFRKTYRMVENNNLKNWLRNTV